MYPAEMITPMKADLTGLGFEELLTPSDVDIALTKTSGTVFLVFNSVCGCAAGSARPAIRMAVKGSSKLPDKMVTAFAGVDREAVSKAREYTLPYPPSSPSMAFFKDGKLIHFIERHQIESNSAEIVAGHLQKLFEQYC